MRNFARARGVFQSGASLALALLCSLGFGCRTDPENLDFSGYHGDGRLIEDPRKLYPTYVLAFPDVRLDTPGTHEFEVFGLPSAGYYFGLALRGQGTDAQRDRYARDGFRCDVEIVDAYTKRALKRGGVLVEYPVVEDGRSHGDFWPRDWMWIEKVRRRIYIPKGMGYKHLFEPTQERKYLIRLTVKCNATAPHDATDTESCVTPMLWAAWDP